MARSPGPPTVRLRIDAGPSSSVGPGKVALLEQIETSGSLSQAARELGMSYRRAWLLLDDLNRAFGEPATTTSVGGAEGGGTRLTAFGRKLVGAYREMERAVDQMAASRLGWLTAAPERPLTSEARRRLAPHAATRRRTRDRGAKRP